MLNIHYTVGHKDSIDINSNEYFNNEILFEVKNSLIKEAVTHFLKSRPRTFDDDSRYFYHKEELDAFYSEFEKKGGNLDLIEVVTLLDDNDEFFCYDVHRIRKNKKLA